MSDGRATSNRVYQIGCHCSKTWAIVEGQWRIVVNGPTPDCPRHGTFARTGTPYDMHAAGIPPYLREADDD